MTMERCPWCDTKFPAESLHEYVCPLNPAVDTETCPDCDGYGWKLLTGKVDKVWPCRRCGTLGAIRPIKENTMTPGPVSDTKLDPGEISDGYHTFNELYEHRHALFLALAAALPGSAWASKRHADGSKIEGWFIAGLSLRADVWADEGDSDRMPSEFRQISYHLPDRLWPIVEILGIVTENPPAFDGHTSDDVVTRLMSWAKWSHPEQQAISSAELIARTDTPEIRGAVSEQVRTFTINWFHDAERLQHSHSMDVHDAEALTAGALRDVHAVMQRDDRAMREALAEKTGTAADEWRTEFGGFTDAERDALTAS